MPQINRPATKVRIVPKDGEIEITLNINITVDGKVVATADNANVAVEEESPEEDTKQMIPDFFSGIKLDFGKKEGS